MPAIALPNSAHRLVWMDLEMTGLDPERDVILEAAAVITDADLDIVATGPSLVIHYDLDELPAMDAWNQRNHTSSGLLQQVRDSDTAVEEAEATILQFVSDQVEPQSAPLCGNSIWQDRRFLCKHMPCLERYLHYRIVDVSSVKELAKIWHPRVEKQVRKRRSHRAMDDILESIGELRLYRDHLFMPA